MVWPGAVLGLRWAEVAGLTVGSLELLSNTVTVTHQLGRDGRLGRPKSGAGRRRFAIPDELSAVLATHLATGQLSVAEPDRLVFTAPGGGPLDYSHWRRRVWQPAVAGAGLDGARLPRPPPGERLGARRHGVDVKTAQVRLGHTDPRLTLGVYAQVVPECDRAAARALGRALFQGWRTDRADGA